MHVCFFSLAKGWGGGELLLSYLIEGLGVLGVETSIITRKGSPMSAWAARRDIPRRFEVTGRGLWPRDLWIVRAWLREITPDILVLNDPHAITSGGIASWLLGIPRLGIRHTIFRVSARKHRLLTDHIVCVSNAARDACLVVGVPMKMTTVIHCGLPTPEVPPDHVEAIRCMFRTATANSDGESPARHLLAVGSLIPVKGFDTTIQAVAQGKRRGKNWHVWLAGEGPERSALTRLAADLKIAERVHFLGFRDDVVALMAAADAFVSCSRSEGLPLVLVEALQIGCPIASTPVGGCHEALKVDESGTSPFAEIFPPDCIDEAFTALERATQQDSTTQGRREAARQWAAETFSQQSMARRHLALYEKLLRGQRADGVRE
ncbi:MAG: glycosyltransferase [Planctomycetota bacterium]|nr:glycosyltransferase [Planctomycetota bacterium]